MKLLLHGLLFVALLTKSQAQNRYFFSLAELKQLASCPDHDCFRKLVVDRGYEYTKTEQTTISSGLLTTYTYRVLNTGTQPRWPEHLILYADKGSLGSMVHFFTRSASFPAFLDSELAQERYQLTTNQIDSDGTRKYVQEDDELVWTLSRYQPGFSRGAATHSIALNSLPKQLTNVTSPVAGQTSSAEPAHLGGNWDAKYPVFNAADLLRAEREYAANYERQHGKVGHTFSRCDKVRIQAVYAGQYRPITDDRWNDAFETPLRYMGYGIFADEHPRLYKQEVLFKVANELIWMPIQEPVVAYLRKEAKLGQAVTLYTVFVSHHDFGGTLYLSCLINEFAATKNASAPADTPPVTAGQPAAVPTTVREVEDFRTFVQRFSADKTFQLERIKFPLTWIEDTNDKRITHRETRNTWQHHAVLKKQASDLNVSVGYPTDKTPTDASVIISCENCGFQDTLFFKRINNWWYCVGRSVLNG